MCREDKEKYDREAVCAALGTRWTGRTVHFYERTDSTNLRAALEAREGAGCGALIVADAQTAGRGRRGRAWESPAGCNLYFTLVLRPRLS